jgi:hypothetical protein
MKIVTSDGGAFEGFEHLQPIVEKTCKIPIIENVNKKEDGKHVSYNGYTIAIDNQSELAEQIPGVLDKMRVCSWGGRVFASNSNEVFHKEFLEYLNFLLTWLKSIGTRGDIELKVEIRAFQMRSVIRWMLRVMEEYESQYSESEFVTVENMIDGVLEKA